MDLFGILGMAQQSLQTQRKGLEVAGNNMANASTVGYSRQRVKIQSTSNPDSEFGSEGTGAQAVAVQQQRDAIVDAQLASEASITGSLSAQQQALEALQTKVGQQIDRSASSDGTTGVSGQNGLADALSGMFSAFQNLSTQTASSEARQTVISQAKEVVSRFHQVASGISNLNDSLNASVATDVDAANSLLSKITDLNQDIQQLEAGGRGTANELRDQRQLALEELAKYVKADVVENSNGTVDVSIGGSSLVTGAKQADTLEAFDAGGGDLRVRTKTGAAVLNITGGSIHGTMQVRDGELATLQSEVDKLAAALISEVNQIHNPGFSPSGTSGADFFSGTNAASIQINASLANNPMLIQTSGDAAASGDNQVALALAQIGTKNISALNGKTFNESFTETVTEVGSALSGVNSEIDNQKAVTKMLTQRRDEVSGVSLDEEAADLMKFQKAFQASAHVVSVVSDMLDTVVNLK